MKKKKKKSQRKSMGKIILLVVLLLLAASAAIDFFGIPGDEITVNIESGMSSNDIYSSLKKNGVIMSKTMFSLYAKSGSKDFKAGCHTMNTHMGYSGAAAELKRLVANTNELSITFPEGFELREIAALLEEKGVKKASDFINATKEKYDFDFLPPISDGYLEGYLFPDTYNVSPRMKSSDIVNMMLKRFDDVFTAKDKERAKELNMSVHEIVTLASIIEREAARDSERPLVSSVFHNRLKSSEYPFLQSCATVQFILSERKNVLSTADTEIDSPYNTYKYKGLPPGPIASPGRASIQAALYPAKTNYYFFVSNGDGTQTFSETYQQHLNSGVNKAG